MTSHGSVQHLHDHPAQDRTEQRLPKVQGDARGDEDREKGPDLERVLHHALPQAQRNACQDQDQQSQDISARTCLHGMENRAPRSGRGGRPERPALGRY